MSGLRPYLTRLIYVCFWQIVLKNSVLGSVWMLDQAGDSGREEKQLGGR